MNGMKSGAGTARTIRRVARSIISLEILIFVLLLPMQTRAATYYVDQELAEDCTDYDVVGRHCGNGSSHAFAIIDHALSAVRPGDELLLRAGVYSQLNIRQSGTGDRPIVIAGTPAETVTIRDRSKVALWIIGHSDLIIKDLVVNDVQGFGRLENATGIVLDNIDFRTADASGTTGALKFVRSSANRVTNSTFDDGSDLLLLQDASNLNVIQGNTFLNAGHSEISIRCSGRNVLRDNLFSNPAQKAVEIYDCEGVSDAPVRLNDTRRNLLEDNRFFRTKASGQPHNYNAIQHGGQNAIVRHNVFANNRGGGVNYQYYGRESLYVNGNRLYNNTFYNNFCYAIIGQSGARKRFFDNQVRNNLLVGNSSCGGSSQQTKIEDRRAVRVGNNIELPEDPGLIDPVGLDFRLRSTSRAIDEGAFLTVTTAPGKGSSIPVDDAGWFYDGFGIAGELGDLIRLEGSSQTARLVGIDYENNILRVERDMEWSEGLGVHVNFAGDAPDVGAIEFGLTGN